MPELCEVSVGIVRAKVDRADACCEDDARCDLSPSASSSILAHQPDSHDWIRFRKELRRRPRGRVRVPPGDGRYRCRAPLRQEIKLFTFPLATATLLPCAFPCSRASLPCVCFVSGRRAASHAGLQATSPCSGSCSECSAPSNTADAVKNAPRSLSRSVSSVTQSGLFIARICLSISVARSQCRSAMSAPSHRRASV